MIGVMVDTSVWSLAFRRDRPLDLEPVRHLERVLSTGEDIYSTGLILQELLQGFRGPKQRSRILEAFAAIPLIVPSREDHIEAAELRNTCRRQGVQIGTIDALIAQLCLRYEVALLTTDVDFQRIAEKTALKLA